ncbi:MAG: hypothetical protein E7289_08140 [Lachnospiraceae bacterium]|nr:hypothetical protein [Lachnospiraceae bacterium]
METKNVPTIVMLTAGLVTSIVMYVNKYELSMTLKTVLLVFFVFYLFGCLIKRILDKFCPLPEEEGQEEDEKSEEKAEEEDGQSNEDGSVIEKK